MASVDTGAIEGEIARIRSLDLDELRREWRRLYHSEPPRLSRDLFVLGLGYRLQEIAHGGGLSKATRRKLQTIAKALRTNGRFGPTPSPQNSRNSLRSSPVNFAISAIKVQPVSNSLSVGFASLTNARRCRMRHAATPRRRTLSIPEYA
jgi:hypothetical protein